MVKIRVVAPARWIDEDTANTFRTLGEEYDHNISFAEQCFIRGNQLAGTDAERAAALQAAIDADDVDVIWCARGGYGAGRLIGQIEPNRRRMKPLIGYSDATYLLMNAPKLGLQAIHGPMPVDALNLEKLPNLHYAFDYLSRRSHSPVFRANGMLNGQATGNIVVANLCVLTHMLGTKMAPSLDNAILVVEDVGEYLYAIDRMFLHLESAGILSKLSGFGLGSFSDIQDNEVPWGKSHIEIAHEYLSAYRIPVATNLPFGHGTVNHTVNLFSRGTLTVLDGAATLSLSPLNTYS